MNEKEVPRLTTWWQHGVNSSPLISPWPDALLSSAQLSQNGPASRSPSKQLALLNENDLHLIEQLQISTETAYEKCFKNSKSRRFQHKWLWLPYSTFLQKEKRPEMRIRRGWRTVLTSLFHNVCGWQKKISPFSRMIKKKKNHSSVFFNIFKGKERPALWCVTIMPRNLL